MSARWKIVAWPAALVLLFWLLTRAGGIDPERLAGLEPDPDNGEWAFHAGGCASCHGADLAGGLEMDTPFGVFRVPNISPHPEAGIGNWETVDFANAMLRGSSPDGSHYYPAFPYASYARMKVQDVVDLKAWLDSYPPNARQVADHELAFPWNLRRGLGLWKRRYLDAAPVAAIAEESAEVERGRYLVEALGHCGECHTPRDRLGGPEQSQWLAGATSPEGEGRVPNITPHEDGLADWSARDIAYYLKSGFTPDFDTVGGSMVKVQENMALLPDSDRAAIAAYLKAIPARPDSAGASP